MKDIDQLETKLQQTVMDCQVLRRQLCEDGCGEELNAKLSRMLQTIESSARIIDSTLKALIREGQFGLEKEVIDQADSQLHKGLIEISLSQKTKIVAIGSNLDCMSDLFSDCEFACYDFLQDHELASAIKDADALIVRSNIRVTSAVIENSNLQVVGTASCGLDHIDVVACQRRNIEVVNRGDGNIEATAELAIITLGSLSRKLPINTNGLYKGVWRTCTGNQLTGKTLGLIGFGAVGQKVAAHAHTFGMEVLGYSPNIRSRNPEDLGVSPVALDDLIERSDLVSIHIPLNSSTKNLMCRSRLERMQTGSCLADFSRGGITNARAATDLLVKGKLGGLALDVFRFEPLPRSSFILKKRLRNCNFIPTPHLGAQTKEALHLSAISVGSAVRQTLGLRGKLSVPLKHPSLFR